MLRQVLRHGEPDSHSLLGCVAGVTKGEGGRCPTDEHRSVTGQAGAARASVTCVVVTEQLRAYVVRASESLQYVPQQPCFPSHTSSLIPPFLPFPPSPSHACVPQFPLPVCLCFANGLVLLAPTEDCRSVRTRVPGSARPCRSTLDCRSEASEPRAALRRSKSARRRAPRPAAGPPTRAIAGACTVTMATVRPNPPAHLLVLGIVMSEKTYTSRIRWLRAYYSDPLVNSGSAVLVRFVIEANWWARRIVEVPSSASDDVLGVVTMSDLPQRHCAHKMVGWWRAAARWPAVFYGKTDDDAAIDLPRLVPLLMQSLPCTRVFAGSGTVLV